MKFNIKMRSLQKPLDKSTIMLELFKWNLYMNVDMKKKSFLKRKHQTEIKRLI